MLSSSEERLTACLHYNVPGRLRQPACPPSQCHTQMRLMELRCTQSQLLTLLVCISQLPPHHLSYTLPPPPGRLWPRSDEDRAAIRAAGLDCETILGIQDLVKGDDVRTGARVGVEWGQACNCRIFGGGGGHQVGLGAWW